jgi:RNA polymerase sigma factor (sigma-70 family)
MNDNILKDIINNNKNIIIINNYLNIIKEYFNIEDTEVYISNHTSISNYIKNSLHYIKFKNHKLAEYIKDIEKHGKLIEEYRRAYVGSENYGDEYIKGGVVKKPDARQITILKLQEAQRNRIIKYTELEEKEKERKKVYEDLIKLLPSPQQQNVLQMTYFSNLTRNEIANKLCLTVEGVDKNRLRGIENLIEIVWNFIHKK